MKVNAERFPKFPKFAGGWVPLGPFAPEPAGKREAAARIKSAPLAQFTFTLGDDSHNSRNARFPRALNRLVTRRLCKSRQGSSENPCKSVS
jgi:hypothetical protein